MATISFTTYLSECKSKLLANHPDLLALAKTYPEIQIDDCLDKYHQQHNCPENNFNEQYDVKWQPEDRCYNEFLGTGIVLDANLSTGELLVHFISIDIDIMAWPWHLQKLTNNK